MYNKFLAQALKQISGLIIENIDKKINQNVNLVEEKGFICHSASHWFAIRKIVSIWYNLNSTNEYMPEIIGEFYLNAFLSAISQSKYTIFVVKGVFPVPDSQVRAKILHEN